MYFIAILLPEKINEKVLEHKRFMEQKFGCRVALNSPAHITIIPPFWMELEKEEQLQSDVAEISNQIDCFSISTKSFSAFKPKTIFIAVDENTCLQWVKGAADQYFSSKDYKIKRESRPFHPHITVATRDLHKKSFAEAWQSFENKNFDESFDAMGLSVLKHDGNRWNVIYTALFNQT